MGVPWNWKDFLIKGSYSDINELHSRVLNFPDSARAMASLSQMRTFLPSFLLLLATSVSGISQIRCNGKSYENLGLFGFGAVPADARDKYGDTLSIGSSFAIDKGSWRLECTKTKKDRKGKKTCVESQYFGVAWGLPDRGWNTEGTINYQPRLHRFDINFDPETVGDGKKNLKLKYKDTVLLYDFKKVPFTGLDPNTQLNYTGKPSLPAAKYIGDGYGGEGPGGTRASLDPEGLILDNDGGFIISDEYGPYVYSKF